MLELINVTVVAYPVAVALTALAVGLLGAVAYQAFNS